jgi:hypothetical protein
MFDKIYRGEPTSEGVPAPTSIPWDIHQAQPRLMELEALGGFSGEVLDIGCGLGDAAGSAAALVGFLGWQCQRGDRTDGRGPGVQHP